MSVPASISEEILSAAQILWNYMQLHQPLEKCDAAIAMGSHDVRTASYAAKLIIDGWAPLLVCSGATGRLTNGVWKKTEARAFAEEANQTGLDKEKIILEEKSTNTSENLIFSAEVLEKANIIFSRVLLVHKPYMERRVCATAKKVWPNKKVVVTSPPIPMLEYANNEIQFKDMIAIMAGDFQRIIEYPKRGFAIRQEVPQAVLSAFNLLQISGFNCHLLQ